MQASWIKRGFLTEAEKFCEKVYDFLGLNSSGQKIISR